MPEVDATNIGAWVASFILPFIRISSFLLAAPIFGIQMVPRRVRMALALGVTWLVVPLLPPLAPIDALSIPAMLAVLREILVGLALAFLLQMFMQIFILAGQVIAMQMGLGFASMMDPANGVSVAVVGQFYTLLVTLLFLAINGHLVMLDVLVATFHSIPVAGPSLIAFDAELLFQTATWMMASALLLCLPAVTALLVVNIAFGVMSRSAPQLNIFSLGFSVSLLFGMLVWWLSLVDFLPNFALLSESVFESMRKLGRVI